MNTTHEKPNHDDVTHIVDGRTGSVFTPREYEQRQRERQEVRMRWRFIKGPIPVPWIAKAFSLTPSAEKCAVALCYQRGLCRKHEFKIEPARFRELGIDDTARHRGLRALDQASLIRLQKQTSKTPAVELTGIIENHNNKKTK
ncbi:MAG: hypothetical protein P1U58_17575 [Verrucomicrobiales bacterium]|nr:hypothetical protein [Verrucomicrobiales bacterium]